MRGILIGNDAVPDFTGLTGETTEAQDEGRYQAVLTELDLAFTCCGIGTSVMDKSRSNRNIENATEAYSEGLYYLIGASLNENLSRGARYRVMDKLAMLDTKFRELGVWTFRTLREVRIADPGKGFDLAAVDPAAIANQAENPLAASDVREEKGMRPGGYGIQLVKSLVDELVYNEARNEVVMVKYLS